MQYSNTVFCWFCFPQVVQKQVETKQSFDSQLCHEYSIIHSKKLSKSDKIFLKLQSEILGMFLDIVCILY